MGKAIDDLETLELLGSTQWGLLTTSQAVDAGVPRIRLTRLVERGTLQRVRHGVYALPSASGGPLQALRAAWLATDSRPVGTKPAVVVSGQSAAVVHGLGDFVASTYEFSTSVRRQTSQKDLKYRVRELPASDVSQVDGLPVTTVARTIHDLASSGTDQGHLAVAVRDALSTGTTRRSLTNALESRAVMSGYADGQAYLEGLLEMAGYEADPELASALGRYSDAVVQSFTPEMTRSMTNMLEQVARRSGLIGASIDPELSGRMLALMTPHTDAIRASFEKALSPAAVRQLAESAADTLASESVRPGTAVKKGEGTDAERTQSGRASSAADIAGRETGG